MLWQSVRTAWRRGVALIVLTLVLVGCLWAASQLTSEGPSPAPAALSTATPVLPTATPSPSRLPTATPQPSPSPTPAPTATPLPSPTPRPSPTAEPSATPIVTPAEGSAHAAVPNKGSPAPDFLLPQVGGGSMQLSMFRGRPVLLTFGATWCPYCRRQIPVLEEVWDRYKAQGLVVLSVNVGEKEERVAAAIAEEDISYPVLLDATGETALLSYGVGPIPHNLFIDPQGIISAIHIGALDDETISKYLALLLPSRQEEEPGPKVAEQAPDFSLPNAQDGTFTLSDLRGECKVVLVFFHSIC